MFYTEIKDKDGKWANNRHRHKGSKCRNNGGLPYIYGFPCTLGAWCNSKLKVNVLDSVRKINLRRPVLSPKQEEKSDIRVSDDERKLVYGAKDTGDKFSTTSESEVVQYLGIATDEPERIERHKDKKGVKLPLVEIGWTEADCKQWCIDNDLLSPIYTDTCMRGGCWFCHNQGVQQLRELRHNYPDLWALLLKWDKDSPVTFHADGHTVHDFDKRFKAEDEGFISANDKFKWKDLDMQQYNIFHYYDKDGNINIRKGQE